MGQLLRGGGIDIEADLYAQELNSQRRNARIAFQKAGINYATLKSLLNQVQDLGITWQCWYRSVFAQLSGPQTQNLSRFGHAQQKSSMQCTGHS